MSVDSVLHRGRKVRQKLMRSTVRIVRRERGAFDQATGLYDTGSETVIYSGPCHFKPTDNPAERDANTAEREVVIRSYEVVIPWDDGAVEVDVTDVAIITSGDDTSVQDRELPVGEIQYAGDRTSRHITVWDQDQGVTLYA